MKLALGTAQFGLNYGISNSSGKISKENAVDLLSYARCNGVETLDTAIAYGDSEQALGNIGVAGWQVITKLPALPEGEGDIESWVERQLQGSLSRLGVSNVYGLLLHRPQQLLERSGPALIHALERLKQQGLVEKIGASIYQPEELDSLVDIMGLDLIQAPLNVFDRRLIDSGWLARLKDQGAEVHVRSVFMQGLLLMPATVRPEKFMRWQKLWAEWDSWLALSKVDPVTACLGFVLSEPCVDKVIVGVESAMQLETIIKASAVMSPKVPASISSLDIDLLNPARW
ncbi:aldo/keto reductase [Stutzerimonas nitrititolerans]|uniref:aldo/keto reductase n=1 Tax=Stutzerimonas nitrititolerans TaxID=2482751 RepID=UPI0028B129E3|nr:aldo/keto reductase [Stutzerimonas nitrititolerans]